jgi:subtilisin-like proprotein convertase family protein
MCADIRVRVIVGVIAALFLANPLHAQTNRFIFTNSLANNIPVGGPAAAYPSTINAVGVTGTPYHVSVTITLSHTFPNDLDILLVSPSGRAVMLMSDVGAGTDWTSQRFVFDDCAPRLLADLPVTSGRFRPTNFQGNDAMPAGAPTGNYGNTLSDFNFSSTNGTWSLYVNDDVNFDAGVIHSWSITMYTQPTNNTLIGGRNPVSCTAPDYDGDGRTDVAVYRPQSGSWLIAQSGQGGALRNQSWGAPASTGADDIAVPADYDGDGLADFAVYRRTSGEWYILGSFNNSFEQIQFGAASAAGLGDTPVPGDYDGDGRADQAIYRTTSAQWFLRSSAGLGVTSATWGFPPAGDYPAR